MKDLHAKIESPVAGEHCFILAGIGGPDCHTLSLLFLAHTLRKQGAHRVISILRISHIHEKTRLNQEKV